MRFYSSEWLDKPFSWFVYYTYRISVQSNILLVDIGSELCHYLSTMIVPNARLVFEKNPPSQTTG